MKKLLISILILALALPLLAACNKNDDDIIDGSETVKMLAKIDKIEEKIEVTVIDSDYTFGTHLVITGESTEYVGANGESINRADLKVGQTVEIIYSGQVMLSYPPQIVAKKISVCK